MHLPSENRWPERDTRFAAASRREHASPVVFPGEAAAGWWRPGRVRVNVDARALPAGWVGVGEGRGPGFGGRGAGTDAWDWSRGGASPPPAHSTGPACCAAAALAMRRAAEDTCSSCGGLQDWLGCSDKYGNGRCVCEFTCKPTSAPSCGPVLDQAAARGICDLPDPTERPDLAGTLDWEEEEILDWVVGWIEEQEPCKDERKAWSDAQDYLWHHQFWLITEYLRHCHLVFSRGEDGTLSWHEKCDTLYQDGRNLVPRLEQTVEDTYGEWRDCVRAYFGIVE